MAVTKKILSQYDVKLVTEWKAPKEDWEMRSLIAMPNIPKPLHGPGCQPRTVLGATTWNRMRNACYTLAGMKCEICGAKVGTDIEKRQLHAHEVYDIDYANGTSTFVRCVALCAECHLACIHTGRALTLYRRGNPLYPKECWRLMVFDDTDFEKAEKVNSNTQLYKQAGNSIVVNVLEAILNNLLGDVR